MIEVNQSKGYYLSMIDRLLDELLAAHPFPFNEKLSQELPRSAGVYRIYEDLNNIPKTIYVGQSKDLRRRIYRNHFHGPNQNSAFRRKLLSTVDCGNDDLIQEYLASKCFVHYLEIEDKRERNLSEHFAIAVLRPKYND